MAEVSYFRSMGNSAPDGETNPAGRDYDPDDRHPNRFSLPPRNPMPRAKRNPSPGSVRLELPLGDETQYERDLTIIIDAVTRARDLCRDKALRAEPGDLTIAVRKQLECANQMLRRRGQLR